MEVADAFSQIERAIDVGAKSGGYLVVGDPKGNCAELVTLILRKLYPGVGSDRDAVKSHPDVAWLEPAGKSRAIKIDAMRDQIVKPMETTSFTGGWKVGVIVGADRINAQAANAFLKSLEEPTPKTIFLLLTDRPEVVIPTIVSRCQRINLPLPPGVLTGRARAELDSIMVAKNMAGVFARSQAAKALAALLSNLRDEAEDEDVPIVRKQFFTTIMSHARRWMVEGAVPRHLAFRNIEAVDEAYARCERYIPAEAVISFMMDKMVFPK